MMPFFLTMPISRMMPIDGDHAEIDVTAISMQQRADAGRGQRRQDGDRMDQALIEHAEDDVDDDQRGGDQDGSLDSERLEGLALPWKLVGSDAGLPVCCSICLDRVDRVAERDARLEVERDGHRRKHALVVDQDRRRP